MAKKTKIRKNLTDTDMLVNYKEEPGLWCLEDTDTEEPVKKVVKAPSQEAGDYFTPELQDKVNKALLQLKIKLFNEGIIDYEIKVTLEGKQVLLTPVPLKEKKKNISR